MVKKKKETDVLEEQHVAFAPLILLRRRHVERADELVARGQRHLRVKGGKKKGKKNQLYICTHICADELLPEVSGT